MFIKRGRLTKGTGIECCDITARYRFIGSFTMYERGGISYIRCASAVILKHDAIDGDIHLKKGTYKYSL